MGVRTDLYKELYSILSNNLTLVNEVSAQNPDVELNKPAVVLSMPSLDRMSERFNNGDSQNGTMEVEIIALTVEDTLKVADEVENVIYNNKSNFTVDDFNLGESNVVPIDVAGGFYYSYIIPVEFIYRL